MQPGYLFQATSQMRTLNVARIGSRILLGSDVNSRTVFEYGEKRSKELGSCSGICPYVCPDRLAGHVCRQKMALVGYPIQMHLSLKFLKKQLYPFNILMKRHLLVCILGTKRVRHGSHFAKHPSLQWARRRIPDLQTSWPCW